MVYYSPFFLGKSFLRYVYVFKNIWNRQIKVFGKIVITLVPTWNRHYCASTITRQNIISNPYRNRLLCNWVACISSSKGSRNGFHICHSIPFRTLGSGLNVCRNRRFLLRRTDTIYIRMFRC